MAAWAKPDTCSEQIMPHSCQLMLIRCDQCLNLALQSNLSERIHTHWDDANNSATPSSTPPDLEQFLVLNLNILTGFVSWMRVYVNSMKTNLNASCPCDMNLKRHLISVIVSYRDLTWITSLWHNVCFPEEANPTDNILFKAAHSLLIWSWWKWKEEHFCTYLIICGTVTLEFSSKTIVINPLHRILSTHCKIIKL